MRSKLFVLAAMLVVASMLLTACQPAAAPTPETIVQTVVVEGESQTIVVTATPEPQAEVAEPKVLRLNMGPGDIPTLDPSLAEDTSSNQIIDLLTIGLGRQNEVTTEMEKGLATDWTYSEDGKTITFKLRNDINWVKYDAVSGEVVKIQDCEGKDRVVTADDFAYGMMRTLDPANSSPYAYVLGFAIEGAQDVIDGVEGAMDKLGVKVVDPQTIEITFKTAAVYNLNIASMWVAHAEPKWLIEGDDCTEARGDRWTETGFNQSYGPYVLKEWVHDSFITLVANPFWPGMDSTPQPKIGEVTWVMLDEVPAFAEYEAGNIDTTAVPQADIDRVKTDPVLSAELKIAPNLCTYYLGFNTKAKFVDDPRVRRALSMAIDRQSLIDNVLKGGQEPAQWFSRPGLAGAPTIEKYPDLGVKFNPEEAKATLQEYLDEKKLTVADLDISYMFNTSSGHQKIAEAVQQMWKDNLGLEAKLVNQEWAVYLATVKSKDTPQVWRLGWCQDYPDANNFIAENFAAGASSNPAEKGEPYGGVNWKNETFEKGILDAAVEMDVEKRVQMYADLEQLLVYDEAVIMPLYWYTRVTVTKPYVSRTFSVLGGFEKIDKWDIDMAAKP